MLKGVPLDSGIDEDLSPLALREGNTVRHWV